MTPTKKSYLKRIRKESAYPTFRSIIGLISGLLYAVGILAVVGCILWLSAIRSSSHEEQVAYNEIAAGGILLGLLIIGMGKIFKEISLMVADMADSLTDIHSRYEQ